MTDLAIFEVSGFNRNGKYYQYKEPNRIKNEEILSGVFNSTSVVHNSRLFFMFGELSYDNIMKERQCSDQFVEFDIIEHSWVKRTPWHNP